MKFRFTNHVKYRVLERGIKMIDIEDTIRNPDYHTHAYDNKALARKSFDGYGLEVIYVKSTETEALIITAYKI